MSGAPPGRPAAVGPAPAPVPAPGYPSETPFRRKGVWGWMGFDFAAQPFFTVVLTFVFGPYFTTQLAPDPATGQAWWSGAATVTGLLVAFVSPALGSIADRAGRRKPWIAAFAAVKVAALLALWTAAPGSPLLTAAVLIVLAQVAAEFSIVFNDAMMPHLVARKALGRVSNAAWGLGYAGGLIFLFATLAFLAGSPETGRTLLGLDPLFGLDPATGEGARATGPLAGLWYVLFILPMFLLTPDRPGAEGLRAAARHGLTDLLATIREVRGRKPLFKFLLARMVYQDGLSALLILGGAFAAGMFGWSLTESGVFGILLNVAAIFGCLAAGLLDDRLGPKFVVTLSVLLLLAATLGIASTAPGSTLFGLVVFAESAGDAGEGGGLFASPAERAYLLYGSLIGLAFGPVQASSRSWLARSIASEEAGRYFGLYAFTGRATSFLATGSVAVATAVAAGFTDPLTASRIGMSTLVVFFAIGLAILAITEAPPRR